MNRKELNESFPSIASVFEGLISDPVNAKKYRRLIYNYRKNGRGISMEKIFEIFIENSLIVSVGKKKWFEEL